MISLRLWLLGVLVLFLIVFVSGQAHSHDHGHSHSHEHGHSHDHSHSHSVGTEATKSTQKPVQQAKVPPSAKYEIKKDDVYSFLKLQITGVWGQAFLATTLIGIAPIAILLVVPLISTDASGKRIVNHSLLKTLLGFAVGGLLGDVFLHLLPHALNPHETSDSDAGHSHSHSHSSEKHDHSQEVIFGLVVLSGIVSFFIIEKVMRIKSSRADHSHSHSQNHTKKNDEVTVVKKGESSSLRSRAAQKQGPDNNETETEEETTKEAHTSKVTAYLNMIADSAHNFTDGMAIGASFLVHPAMGWSTTVAVFFHEIPHELGDYAILVQSGYSKKEAMLIQVLTAVGALVGTLVALIAGGQLESIGKYILPFTAGGFIYVATVNVIPELLQDTSVGQTIKELITMSMGIGIMALIAIYE